jgi:DNA-binding XRE family transcriptional regulator
MRMRQPTGGLRDVRVHGLAPVRANGGATPPPVAGRDPQIGNIFRNMRAAMRLSREVLARHLATTPATIDDLEAGAVASLPHWRETVRIVRSYCEMLRLDPEPLLWRIENQLRNTGADFGDPPTAPGAPGTRQAGPPSVLLRQNRARAPSERRNSRGALRLFALGTPVLAVAAALYFVHVAPAPIYRAISRLPQPIAGHARAALDQFLLYTAPQREGLRWIDIGDPQLRKVDKLPTSTR